MIFLQGESHLFLVLTKISKNLKQPATSKKQLEERPTMSKERPQMTYNEQETT